MVLFLFKLVYQVNLTIYGKISPASSTYTSSPHYEMQGNIWSFIVFVKVIP